MCLVGGVVGQSSWTSCFLSSLFYHTLSCINHSVCCSVLLMAHIIRPIYCYVLRSWPKMPETSIANTSLLTVPKMKQGVSLAPPSLPPPSIENLRNHVFRGDGNKQNKMSSCNVYELFEHLFRSHHLTVSMYDRVRPFSFVSNLSSNLSLKL